MGTLKASLPISVIAIMLLFSVSTRALSLSPDELTREFEFQKIRLVEDTVDRRIEKVLLFLSIRQSLKMNASFINQMGSGVVYYVVKNPDIHSSELLNRIDPYLLKRIEIKFLNFDRCFTPWVQDYFLRAVTEDNKPLLIPTYSQNLIMNECKPFELGVADALEKNFREFGHLEKIDYNEFHKLPRFFQIHRVNALNGEMYANSEGYRSFFPIRTFRPIYGEGGSRIPTKNHLFIERVDLDRTLKQWMLDFSIQSKIEALQKLEKFLKKRIVAIGSKLPANKFYIYHIDFFLTPIDTKNNGTVIFMGHPTKTQEVLGSSIKELPGYDPNFYAQKTAEANSIENELRQNGFIVERLPILFMKLDQGDQTLTFNNAIQTKNEKNMPAVFIPTYDLGPQYENLMQALRIYVHDIYSKYDIETNFVEGGEQYLDHNGQLRCSTGVLSYRK